MQQTPTVGQSTRNYFHARALGARKRERTRGLLLDSAIGVFADKGIEEASIQEITELAGLANGTFYNHFTDKDELALASAAAIVLEIARRLDAELDGEECGIERIVVSSWAFIELALSVPSWTRVVLSQYQRGPIGGAAALRYLQADIEQAVAEGDVTETVDAFLLEQIAAIMMAALQRLLSSDAPDASDPSDSSATERQALLQRLTENILRLLGLTANQARRRVDRARSHRLIANGIGFDAAV
ncbi:MAG: TetR/AcrR family transcriptional regulator [Pseudomonadota bacterium]